MNLINLIINFLIKNFLNKNILKIQNFILFLLQNNNKL